MNDQGVRYVVIGGVAAVLRGSPVVTQDTDICYARDQENLERLAAALRVLGARLRGATEDVPFLLDAKTLAAGDHFTLTTTAGDLDCLGTPAGTNGFVDLDAAASDAALGEGVVARVASVDDLIRMKRAAGRIKDEYGLLHLQAIREALADEGA